MSTEAEKQLVECLREGKCVLKSDRDALAQSEARWGDEKLRAERLSEAVAAIVTYSVLASSLHWLARKINEEVEKLVADGHLTLEVDENPDGEVPGA